MAMQLSIYLRMRFLTLLIPLLKRLTSNTNKCDPSDLFTKVFEGLMLETCDPSDLLTVDAYFYTLRFVRGILSNIQSFIQCICSGSKFRI
ncbi:hypothetical protein SUGI_0218600 [Cryptomeria japonica]|nr:hypothetical protein SUGI_0218600 [Cryptomeria japonica]